MGEIIDFRTNEHNIKTITSLEIAEMMEISHKELLRKLNGSADRKGICTILTEHQMVPSDYYSVIVQRC